MLSPQRVSLDHMDEEVPVVAAFTTRGIAILIYAGPSGRSLPVVGVVSRSHQAPVRAFVSLIEVLPPFEADAMIGVVRRVEHLQTALNDRRILLPALGLRLERTAAEY